MILINHSRYFSLRSLGGLAASLVLLGLAGGAAQAAPILLDAAGKVGRRRSIVVRTSSAMLMMFSPLRFLTTRVTASLPSEWSTTPRCT